MLDLSNYSADFIEALKNKWATDVLAFNEIEHRAGSVTGMAIIQYKEDEPSEYKYCCQFNGSGKYFTNLEDCRKYCLERARSASCCKMPKKMRAWSVLADYIDEYMGINEPPETPTEDPEP